MVTTGMSDTPEWCYIPEVPCELQRLYRVVWFLYKDYTAHSEVDAKNKILTIFSGSSFHRTVIPNRD